MMTPNLKNINTSIYALYISSALPSLNYSNYIVQRANLALHDYFLWLQPNILLDKRHIC